MHFPEQAKVEIPKIFYSDANDAPFSNCLVCNSLLLVEGKQYVIEKAIKRYKSFDSTDTVYEYAMCMNCYFELQKSFSESSQRKIEEYMLRNSNTMQRLEKLNQTDHPDLEDWVSDCIIKGKPMKECTEYQIMCECVGSKMVFGISPIMICGEAVDEIMQLLSNQTLGEIGRFQNQYFDVPPELKINPTKPDIVIL